MICSSSSPPIRRRPGEGRGPRGFTLVELLVVILILAVLIALLLPAINGALRTAKNAAVGGEINQLAQALASFKAKYGDYPPSRILLIESGNYAAAISNSTPLNNTLNPNDITVSQLAQRSIAALRKFFPRVQFSTSGSLPFITSSYYYDFNGNGSQDGAYILQGHECLVFFLGGITFSDTYPVTVNSNLSMTGFGKDPTNPFSNNIVGNSMYSANRQPPLFEFAPNRLLLDTSSPYPAALGLANPGIPGYVDSLGNTQGNGQTNYYAYFSAYGSGGYDPNDVNFAEVDSSGNGPIGLDYSVSFPIPTPAITTVPNSAASASPNPYTTGSTTVPSTGVTSYINPQTFQIISSGIDGQYGVGGQYAPDNSAGLSLPLDSNTALYFGTTQHGIRSIERDNITNFHNGRLD